MPEYRIGEAVILIDRNALLLDTNVLVDAFEYRDDFQRQQWADTFLGELDGSLLVPTVVLIEAWGLLVGSKKLRAAGMDLLTWVNLPGRATIIPPRREAMEGAHKIAGGFVVDCVDAMLVELATDITKACGFRPPLRIATSDTRDFTRMANNKPTYQFRVLDTRSGETN